MLRYLVFLLILKINSSQDLMESDTTVPPEWAIPTVKLEDVTDSTTLSPLADVTDLPLQLVDDAVFLEVGEYTTMSFQYVNDQYVGWQARESTYDCYEDFVKCILSQTVLTHVCAINEPDSKYRGLRTLPSICDMLLDNCRRGFRFWHAMKFGACGHHDKGGRLVLYPQGK